MKDTGIEWTDDTWNPTDGCDVCSPGCANCYAMRMAGRFSGPGRPYEGLVAIGKNKRAVWNGEGRFRPDRLRKPLTWRKPRRVFVNSMSDLFYDAFTNEEIAAVYGIMTAARHHTFQVLTKRATRMREWFEWLASQRTPLVTQRYSPRLTCRAHAGRMLEDAGLSDRLGTEPDPRGWPLPNVWQGVSVENKKHGVPRIRELQRTPAAVRMLSIEPLLEDLGELDLTGIHWVIVGCESGPGARPCEVDWIRSIRDQCKAAGVAFFLKQATEKIEHVMHASGGTYPHAAIRAMDGSGIKTGRVIGAPYLDGVQHLAFPVAHAA